MKTQLAHNTGKLNFPFNPIPAYNLIPDTLKRAVGNLRLWGVFCASSESVIYHAVKRSECVRFIKAVPSVASAGLYIIRFDSAF